jgi:hypothetical protein
MVWPITVRESYVGETGKSMNAETLGEPLTPPTDAEAITPVMPGNSLLLPKQAA